MTKTISVRVSPAFDRMIRVAAAQRDMNRSDFIKHVLEREVSVERDREEHEHPLELTQAGDT